MARPKVVWILGSGFSKHVGGPLLNELLTPRSMRELETLFPHPALPTLHAVYEIFRSHVKGISNSPYWEHAEEFLSFVDSAADPQSRRHKVTEDLCSQHKTQQFNGSPQELRRRAAIAIAAECIAFLSTIDLDTESWQPYLQWGEAVSDPDAIITFNYDRVLEEMAEHPQRICNFSQNTVQIPNRLNVAAGSVPIYKLHGSVDWFLLRDPNGNQFTWLEPDLPKQLGLGFEPLIATPGNTKKNYCDEYLSDLWKASRDHLREADVVVFMGYRFPPSDSQAVTSVLGALKDNDKSLRVHVVLGPDIRQPDTVRLEGLLRHTLKAKRTEVRDTRYKPVGNAKYFQLITHPLFAQDFMSVFTDRDLHGIDDATAFMGVLQREADGN